jgi:putative hydrolase of the HAD superfamily
MCHGRGMLPPALAHIDTWVFDLDNTLYPPSAGLFDLIDDRMGGFIARLLGCDLVAARRVQKAYFHDHGTTLAGLMHHHGVAPEEFLVDVHEIALDRLSPCPRLAAGLAALPGRRIIFTNADADYAARVLAARGLDGLFDAICDIRATGYVPKPQMAAYQHLVAAFGVNPARALFVEDMARNLTPAKALGMTTLWLDNGAESGHRDLDPSAIDHRAADLADWLAGLPDQPEAQPGAQIGAQTGAMP